MKAIQIFEVNKKLLEQWGEKEELTWANSFGDLVGDVLVVDERLPQGYAVMPASIFLDGYRWVSNFGTHGWSDIKDRHDQDPGPEEESIFILWVMNADSWNGTPSMKSIHKTLEGAVSEIPENIRQDSLKRELCEPYVANYTYLAVEKRALKN